MTDAEEPVTDASDDHEEAGMAVVLDYLPHGRADDDRPQYQKSPLAQLLGEDSFRLFEATLTEDASLSIGDRLQIDPAVDSETVVSLEEISYDDLSRGAEQELEYVVEEIIENDERRFVDFYNDAQPITLRLHQLDLLPGIGKTLRNNVLDQRKREPFESFDELEERVSGLHRPKEVLVERVMEELRDDDLKYKAFVGAETTDSQ